MDVSPLALVTADFGTGPVRPGVRTAEGIVDLAAASARLPGEIPPAPVLALLVEKGICSGALLARWIEGLRSAGSFETALSPKARVVLPFRAGKILAVARNYAAHAKELGNEVPEAPLFFSKASSIAVGPGSPIVIPRDLEGEVHHEAELAVVIGRAGRRIPRETALDYVAGYACANDVTARTLQLSLKDRKLPWFAGKNLDTFLAFGPAMVPADLVSDPGALTIRCRVNGELRQDAPTSLMLNDVPALIEHVSRHLTLLPLDVILTGTPAGVGPLVAGDTVEVEIDGLGTLANPVVHE